MSGDGPRLEVSENAEEARYEIRADGELAGFVTLRRRPGRIAFVHTEVDPEFEGKGIGSALARSVLDSAREQSLAVVPLCPFISSWIDKHPEYADLVAEDARESGDG